MICQNCNKEFPRKIVIDGKLRDLKSRKYCLDCVPFNVNGRADCSSEPIRYCLYCNSQLSNRQISFCSQFCSSEYHYTEYIKRWKLGLETGLRGSYDLSTRIRRYLFEKYNNKCCKCGWCEINQFTGNIPLEVHHVDGDYTNNDENNLELLCPNCHSLTATYKSSNTNGRKMRSQYSL